MTVLAIDIGGTAWKYAWMSEAGDILDRGQRTAPDRKVTLEECLVSLASLVQRRNVTGIALAIPGVVKGETVIACGRYPCLSGVNLAEMVKEKFQLSCTIENDARCAAWAELGSGNLLGIKDGAMLVIGHSLGCALILDGKLRQGYTGCAGEVSSACFNLNNPTVKASYGQGYGVDRLLTLVREEVPDCGEIDGRAVFARLKDPRYVKALGRYTDELAMILFSLNVILDLEKICLAGGIVQSELLASLQESIQNLARVHPDLAQGDVLPLPVIADCKFQRDANLFGALACYTGSHESGHSKG